MCQNQVQCISGNKIWITSSQLSSSNSPADDATYYDEAQKSGLKKNQKGREREEGQRGMPNGKLVKGEIGRDNCFGSYNGTERKIALALACFLRSQSPSQPASFLYFSPRPIFRDSFFFLLLHARSTYSALL